MIVAGSSQKKKASTLFSLWQSPVENSPGKNEISTIKTTNSGGCCRRLNDCMSERSIVSTKESHQQRRRRQSELRQQVADLEREVLKQKELRIMYRKRMETTQDYLKYCLQVAQENGFLDLIIQNKDDQQVKVADFGHARFLDDAEMALTGETGTYVYMAPEVIFRCEPYNQKSDVYSFAVILNELMTGDYPYIETDFGPSKIAMEVAEGKLRPMLPHEDNDQLGELIDLISQSWDHAASVRPSFATITSSLRKIQQRIIEGA
ncbi:hypothetical protein NC652_017548 [Populus alba x Populus x berolinensis]|nr:hypothetical protein NC652_017548 [Populus alba x Populus x berolinensis]